MKRRNFRRHHERHYRCGKGLRRKKRGGRHGTSGSPCCPFARMHMPPPLPLRPRRRKRFVGGCGGISSSPLDVALRSLRLVGLQICDDFVKIFKIFDSNAPKTSLVAATADREASAAPCDDEGQSFQRLEAGSQKEVITSRANDLPASASTKQTTGSKRNSKRNNNNKQTKSKKKKKTKLSLIDLARMQDWSNLILLAPKNKREAKRRDSDGLLPLHWACSGGPPLRAVRALLESYPRAVRCVDGDGSTPLHFACHYGGSADVVNALLDSYPDAARVKDAYGRAPLYHAVDKGAGIDVVKALLRVDPAMATSLCVASEEKAERLLRRGRSAVSRKSPLTLAFQKILSSPKCRTDPGKGRCWEKAMALLAAGYLGSIEDERPHDPGGGGKGPEMKRRNFRPLHAALALSHQLPPLAIDVILRMHPEQLREKDEVTGFTPLAVVASSDPRLVPSHRFDELIGKVLRARPDAAGIPDGRGRFPLTLALARGRDWGGGARELFQAFPNAVERRDGTTGLFPFMTAAVAAAAVSSRSKTGIASREERSSVVEVPKADVPIPETTPKTKPKIGSSADEKTKPFDLRRPTDDPEGPEGAHSSAAVPTMMTTVVDDGEARRLSAVYDLLRLSPSLARS